MLAALGWLSDEWILRLYSFADFVVNVAQNFAVAAPDFQELIVGHCAA